MLTLFDRFDTDSPDGGGISELLTAPLQRSGKIGAAAPAGANARKTRARRFKERALSDLLQWVHLFRAYCAYDAYNAHMLYFREFHAHTFACSALLVKIITKIWFPDKSFDKNKVTQ